MACGDTGDVNVFLSRVRFNDHLPSQTPASSTMNMLTFADMVIALDNKVLGIGDDVITNSTILEKNPEDDHTYASNNSHKMTTRSQALRINNQQTMYDKRHLELPNNSESECLSNSDPGGVRHVRNDSFQDHGHSLGNQTSTATTPNQESTSHQELDMDKKVKRSSSVENITAGPIAIDTFGEWPQTSRKNSPRKSCSFEEVSKNTTGSKKSEEKRKGGSSGQLHRLVNDTVEFPCWPRKADHTYATATWDGTAASHSLFEQELNQQDKIKDDLEMEVTESLMFPLKIRNPNSHLDEVHRNAYELHSHSYQKDDHTYVKQSSNSSTSFFPMLDPDQVRNPGYSCATFPRQKSREDHTYFSSGLTKHTSSSSGGKDWSSVQTVTNYPQSKETTDSTLKNVAPQILSRSTKKDHNYFTSAS